MAVVMAVNRMARAMRPTTANMPPTSHLLENECGG